MKLKYWGLSLLFFTLSYSFAWSQILERRAEIEKIKKEFITDRVNLSPEQEVDFWPVYEEYTRDKIRIRRSLQSIKRKGFSVTASDEDLSKVIDRMFSLREEELKLDLSTKEKLLKIINVRQLAELYRSEQEFLRQVLKVLRGNGNK